jgi:hypothetical protein
MSLKHSLPVDADIVHACCICYAVAVNKYAEKHPDRGVLNRTTFPCVSQIRTPSQEMTL